jgi:dihydrofolate reductase
VELIQTLLKNDLVDEFHLMVFPLALGSGKRLFAEGTVPAAFTGSDVKTSNSGVIIATYQRAGAVNYGTYAPD